MGQGGDEAVSPGGVDSPVTVVEAAHGGSVRSPSDLFRLAVAAVALVVSLLVEWLTGDSIPQGLADLLQGLDTLPEPVVKVALGVTRLAVLGLFVAELVRVVVARRWRNLATVAVAMVAAAAVTALANELAPAPVQAVVDVEGVFAAEHPTSVVLAAAAAAVTAAAPWLERTWRRAGWLALLALALVRFLTAPISFETERAMLLGWLAGAVAVVAFGGPDRRPRGAAIASGLRAVGVPLARLEQASLDARGSTPYFGSDLDGRRLFVKAVGQDERSADLLFRVYRWLTPRDLADGRPFTSLRRAVEHEALVALAARQHGVRTPLLVAFASAEPKAYVLAYEAVDGRSLDRLDASALTDELLRAVWEQVALLRSHRIAHRDLRLANVFVGSDGSVWMIDFGFSELAALDTHLAGDVAELLASSSLLVGPERAVAVGASVVGPEALATAVPRLKPWALSGATRTAVGERPGLLDEIIALVDR